MIRSLGHGCDLAFFPSFFWLVRSPMFVLYPVFGGFIRLRACFEKGVSITETSRLPTDRSGLYYVP